MIWLMMLGINLFLGLIRGHLLTPSLVVAKIIWESSYSTVYGILNATGNCLGPVNYPTNTPKKQLSTCWSEGRRGNNWGQDSGMHQQYPRPQIKMTLMLHLASPPGLQSPNLPESIPNCGKSFLLTLGSVGCCSLHPSAAPCHRSDPSH